MKKADWILLICILCVAGMLALWSALLKDADAENKDKNVVISIDGEVYQVCSIMEAQELFLPTAGEDSVLVIENGGCYMKSADCPDQICVRCGMIQAVGERIVCLPHKIIVTIEGEAAYDN